LKYNQASYKKTRKERFRAGLKAQETKKETKKIRNITQSVLAVIESEENISSLHATTVGQRLV